MFMPPLIVSNLVSLLLLTQFSISACSRISSGSFAGNFINAAEDADQDETDGQTEAEVDFHTASSSSSSSPF